VPDAVGGPAGFSFTLLDPDSDSTSEASSVTVTIAPAAGIVNGCGTLTATGSVQ
jgi:hypothetical protein